MKLTPGCHSHILSTPSKDPLGLQILLALVPAQNAFYLCFVFDQPFVNLFLDGCDEFFGLWVEFCDGFKCVVKHIVIVARKPLFEECSVNSTIMLWQYTSFDEMEAEHLPHTIV